MNVLDDLPCAWMLREWILERFSVNSKIGADISGVQVKTFIGLRAQGMHGIVPRLCLPIPIGSETL